jgi:hypothetical protein
LSRNDIRARRFSRSELQLLLLLSAGEARFGVDWRHREHSTSVAAAAVHSLSLSLSLSFLLVGARCTLFLSLSLSLSIPICCLSAGTNASVYAVESRFAGTKESTRFLLCSVALAVASARATFPV